jgi:hypothetical protein
MSDEYEEQREEMRKIGRLQTHLSVIDRIKKSDLIDLDKVNLTIFVKNFSQMEFNIGSRDMIEQLYATKKFTPPYWMSDLVIIVAGIGIFQYVLYSFKGFSSQRADASPRHDRVSSIYYSGQGTYGYATEKEYLKTDLYDLFPILRDNDGGSCLAINGKDHTDRSIYEFDIRDIWDAYSEGGPRKVLEVPVRVFDSYTEMLANISRVMIDGVVYEAQEN